MTSYDSSIAKLQQQLKIDFPAIHQHEGEAFYWSSREQTVFIGPAGDAASLLHEYGHASLVHTNYGSDVDLLAKEVAAWDIAKKLASTYGYSIDEELIDRCLDTYRDWLHMRSTCPACGIHGVQHAQSLYMCINCSNTWKVSASRHCRPYRQRTVAINAK